MIYVCDKIMGCGKSQSAITYMNEHPTKKYIYITPYLDEASRITDACPKLNFVEPLKLRKYRNSKVNHTMSLVLEGKNIASTHNAFKNYNVELLEAIKDYEYTLIIDECLDLLESCDFHRDDIQMAIDSGHVVSENGELLLTDKEYNGNLFRKVFELLKRNHLYQLDYEDASDSTMTRLYYCILPKEFLSAFKDVYILTYLFNAQSLSYFLEIYNLPYKFIGIKRIKRGNGYAFSPRESYTPEYVTHIKDMIEIVDNDRLNSIGDEKTALSKAWFEKHIDDGGVNQLKNNIYNVFRNYWKESDVKNRMWSTFKCYKPYLKGKGYSNGFTNLNQRATNAFKNARYLVYACNTFMNVGEKLFFTNHGISVNDDDYALAIMLQWIWRSAIRDGEKVYLYIPSSRMRHILINWMDNLEKGGGG